MHRSAESETVFALYPRNRTQDHKRKHDLFLRTNGGQGLAVWCALSICGMAQRQTMLGEAYSLAHLQQPVSHVEPTMSALESNVETRYSTNNSTRYNT